MSTDRHCGGFTLVELLVATFLLSLVTLGLLTAMRSVAQTEARIDARIRREEGLRTSEQLLRGVFGAIAPRFQSTTVGGTKQIAFVGGADQMRWIGVMPARHGAGGLYQFHLFLRPGRGNESAALVLQFDPLTNHDSPLAGDPGQSRTLASNVISVSFRYQDAAQPDALWLPTWPHRDQLPRRIGFRVQTVAEEWPEIIVAVIPAVGPGIPGRGGGSGAGPVIGPF